MAHLDSHDRRSRLLSACVAAVGVAASFAAAPAQQPARDPVRKPQPNAAKIYLQACQELRRALSVPAGDDPPLPFNEDDDPDHVFYTRAGWPALVAKGALARQLFEQAAAIPICRFPEEGKRYAEDFHERIGELSYLRELVVAHAWQQLDKRPAATLRGARVLLAYARHLGDDPFVLSSLLRLATEGEALGLVDKALERHQNLPLAELALMAAAIDAHAKSNPTGALLAKKSKDEVRHFLATTIATGDQNAKAIAAVTERAVALVGEIVDPLATLKPEGLDAFRKANEARIQELKAKVGKGKLGKVLESGVGEALASALASMLIADPSGLIESLFEQDQRRAGTRKRLQGRLDRAR